MANKINSLDIKQFVKGECFLCLKKADDSNAYCHYSCCIAYSDEKQKRINEANKESEG